MKPTSVFAGPPSSRRTTAGGRGTPGARTSRRRRRAAASRERLLELGDRRASAGRSRPARRRRSAGPPRSSRSIGVAERDPERAEPRELGRCPRSPPGRAGPRPRARCAPRRCASAPRAASGAPSPGASPRGTSRRRGPRGRAHRGLDRLQVALAALHRETRRGRDERPERKPEQLRLGHETQIPPGEERHPERPRVEVRRVVGGEDDPPSSGSRSRPRQRAR